MKKSIVSDTEWAEKLKILLEATEAVDIYVRYKALGATLVASGYRLQVNEKKIETIPPPTTPLNECGAALSLELPDWADPHAAYYHFEDENHQTYLSVEYLVSNLPENYAELEIATTPELLSASVNVPLVH